MTYRERKEARLARRIAWAATRDRRAAAGFKAAQTVADGIPLGQPILVGHHSEKRHRADIARIDAGMRAGVESQQMAAHHRGIASGIAHQLETSIYTDDHDAPDALRARIAALEEQRDRMKRINAVIRKGPGWSARLTAAGLELTEREKADLLAVATHQPYLCKNGLPCFPAYALSNLSGNIARLRKRLPAVDQLAADRARVTATLAAERGEG